MAADVEQLLTAVLAGFDRVHAELGNVAGQLDLLEESASVAMDTLENSRISLGALRDTVRATRRPNMR